MNTKHLDVSGHPQAAECAMRVERLRAGFEELGFQHVGFHGTQFDVSEFSHITEVLASPDHTAFLELANVPSDPMQGMAEELETAELHTALEDGSLVATAIAPAWFQLHAPKAGYDLVRLEHAEPAELWDVHQQHVRDMTAAWGAPPMKHAGMPMCLAMAARITNVMDWHFRLQWIGLALLTIALIALVAGGMFLFGGPGAAPFGFFDPTIAIGVLVVVVAVLLKSWQTGFGPWFARQFPWPKKQPWPTYRWREF